MVKSPTEYFFMGLKYFLMIVATVLIVIIFIGEKGILWLLMGIAGVLTIGFFCVVLGIMVEDFREES